MTTVDAFVHAPEPKSATVSSPARLPLTLADLERFLSTAKAGDNIVYHRGYLAMDRGSGSRLGDDAGEELDHIATALMVMAEAGRVHLVQRRHGPYDYTYLAVMARGARTRRLA
jgi:hypothetical protein